jgi:hypothetical protein
MSSRSTYENYYRCIKKYVIPFFSDFGNDPITEFQVAQFLKSIHDNSAISEAYKRKIISIFKTALRVNPEELRRLHSGLDKVKLPKTDAAAVQVFSVKEQRLV